jgi:hypothetical protein
MVVDISKYYSNIHVLNIEKTTRESIVEMVGKSVRDSSSLSPDYTP